MAKEKAEKKEKTLGDNINDILAKEFGEGIVFDASTIIDNPPKIIPVSPVVDMILGGGVPQGSLFILTGPPKCGKALQNGSKVYTPTGPKNIEDIKINDLVCTPYQTYTKVTGVYPQGKRPCYKVTFSDESTVNCDEEHLWEVRDRNRNHVDVLPLKDLGHLFIQEGKYKRLRWAIKLGICEFDEQSLPIDPYLLGLLIGDGNIINNVRFTSADEEIIDSINELIKDKNCQVNHYSKIEYGIVKINGYKNYYVDKLRELNLIGKCSHTKFIPDIYLYNSYDNRLKLLQGLMDTDGYADKGARGEYTTTSVELAENFRVLIQSLGMICKFKERYTSNTYKGEKKWFKSYRCSIATDNAKLLFKLSRKIDNTKNRAKGKLDKKIKSIEFLGMYPATCIKIEAEDGLFLTDNFTVTHNTVTSLNLAANAQKYFGSMVYFLNIEGRLKKRDLEGIKGLDLSPSKFQVIGSSEGNILSAEKYIGAAEKLVNTVRNSIIIVDSFSALCTEARYNASLSDRFRDDTPLLLANFCKRISNILPINKNILTGITHRMANQGNGPSQWLEGSGTKIQYGLDVKLKCTHNTDIKAKEVQVGQIIHWEVMSSALSGTPGTKGESLLRYGYGIDKEMEILDLAASLAIIDKSGNWFIFDEEHKFNGKEQAREYLIENPDIYTELDRKMKEMLGFIEVTEEKNAN